MENIVKTKLKRQSNNITQAFVAVCFKFQSDLTQWRSRVEGGKWRHALRPGAQALGANQHTLFTQLKTRLSRNLGQNNMLKNANILEKSCKITAVSGVRPRTHVGLPRMETTPPDSRIVTPTY